ncbi:MAG: hypothetical protein ILO36_05075, partial [Abditibacteriota bacterium]|nr:hypothetical protein [Abditibacteriota bacterium]
MKPVSHGGVISKMSRMIIIAVACFLVTLAFPSLEVLSADTGRNDPTPGVVSTGTDSMGHILEKNSYCEAPSRHIPDIRIYSTKVLEYGVYTEYEHNIVYNPKFNNGSVSYYENEDPANWTIDHFTRLYLSDTALFAKQHELVMHKALDDGFSLDVYWIAKQAREYE